jgi:hypothetical protein
MLAVFRQGDGCPWVTGDPKQNIGRFELLLARADVTEVERKELVKKMREQKRLLEFPGVTVGGQLHGQACLWADNGLYHCGFRVPEWAAKRWQSQAAAGFA